MIPLHVILSQIWRGAAFVIVVTGLLLAGPPRAVASPQAEGGAPAAGAEPASAAEVVVSSHSLATEAGLDVLAAGGTAADAAVAVAAVLSVAEPWFSSVLGGGTWALYYDASAGTVRALDGVGPAGSSATAAAFEPIAEQSGMHQAVVPGAWAGWMQWLREYGELDLGEVMAPAIEHAESGVPVTPEMSLWLDIESENVANWPSAASIYMPDGVFLTEGDTVYQHGMAATFRELVAQYDRARSGGRAAAFDAAEDHLYRGPLAEAIVEYSDRYGGYLTVDDFRSFTTGFVDPIRIDYRGIDVYQNPPNSQGATMLMALNILKGFELSRFEADSAEAIHLQAEAIKLAHIDKYYHIGDPEYVDVPIESLLSEEHAQRGREQIALDAAIEWPVDDLLAIDLDLEARNTTTFHVVDRHGNAAAVTTSLGAQFLVIGDTGIHINNRMRMMAVEDGDPNRIEPGKRVRHTSNPYIALMDGRPIILGGNTGVDTQPQGQVQQFISVVEYGMSAQEAVSRPRFLTTAFPSARVPWTAENTLALEEGIPDSVASRLASIGHTVVRDGLWGNANMIVIDPDSGRIETGADPRGGFGEGTVRDLNSSATSE